jgi:hypothetical protein
MLYVAFLVFKNSKMSKRKLDNEEIKHIAKLSNDVGSIAQLIIAEELEAYNYDWQQLSIKMKEVIQLFNIIKNKNCETN